MDYIDLLIKHTRDQHLELRETDFDSMPNVSLTTDEIILQSRKINFIEKHAEKIALTSELLGMDLRASIVTKI